MLPNEGFILADIEGAILSQEDRELLVHPAVAGVILFARNYQNPPQLKALTAEIGKIRDSLLIMVDQEGGRVQRFQKGFTSLPSMHHWGERYREDPDRAKEELRNTIHTMAKELQSVGVPISLIPVLDVDHGLSEVIGERSFGDDPKLVVALAQVAIDSMHQARMPSIGKHFPGHGGVKADSHKALPVDNRSRQAISESDLYPFMKLSKKLNAVMPAHVVYSEFDDQPAGFSSYWLKDVLRDELKFSGLVISDDLTMTGAAGMGDYPTRASKALSAGCDLVSICNNRSGVKCVLEKMGGYRNPTSQARLKKFINSIF